MRVFVVVVFSVLSLPVLSATAAQADVAPGSLDRRHIAVQGLCYRRATPDRGAIIVTAEVQDMDLKTASVQATRSYERVRDAVKKLGLEALELSTVEYSVNEVREWEKNRSVFKGFKARMGLQVSTASIQKLGDVIEIAAREQIKDVGSLTTFLSREKMMKEHLGCLQEASDNARARAEKLAAALGAKLGDVISVVEQAALPPPARPVPMARAMSKMAADAGPTVEAGTQDLSVTIQANFALK